MSEAIERAERRRAEEELDRAYQEIRDRAESYHNLFNSIRDVIVVTDNDRRILQVNQPALREVFGYELDELAGRSIRCLYADDEGFLHTGREIFDIRGSVKGKILELIFRRKNGEVFTGELYALKRLDSMGMVIGNIGIIRDTSERKAAEEALRLSEMRRYQLQVELAYAAEIQAKLLPRSYPRIPGFDVAARCLPAKQVGGDFFDWQEVCPGVWSFTLGDVMGKGMAAAMLMATVRAALRSVAHNRPSEALRQAREALKEDLDHSESFVTLFHAQLYAEKGALTFVDCGHGFAFLRRQSGKVESCQPRGLPLGVPGGETFQEGATGLESGDTLVVYSDGLIDARPELQLNSLLLAEKLAGATTATEMLDRLTEVTDGQEEHPDDITVLVVHCLA